MLQLAFEPQMRISRFLNLGFYIITAVVAIIDSPNGFHFITLMLTNSLITATDFHKKIFISVLQAYSDQKLQQLNFLLLKLPFEFVFET